MDIILNTVFDNVHLPPVLRPGFSDDFERADGTPLGQTLDGKAWQYSDDAKPWVIDGGAASGAAGANLAYVDGKSSDGLLTAVLSKMGDTGQRAAIVCRATDARNNIGLWRNTAGQLAFSVLEDGSFALNTVLDVQVAEGDTFGLQFSGDQISAIHNGNTVRTFTENFNVGVTTHGFSQNQAGTANRWGSIQFVSA